MLVTPTKVFAEQWHACSSIPAMSSKTAADDVSADGFAPPSLTLACCLHCRHGTSIKITPGQLQAQVGGSRRVTKSRMASRGQAENSFCAR